MSVLIDRLLDGIDQELTTSMGKTVLIERLRVPYRATVEGDAGEGFADFDVDRITHEAWRRREQDRHRRSGPFSWCRPDGALGACLTGPVPEAGSVRQHLPAGS